MHHGLPSSHHGWGPEPWSEHTPMASGMWTPSEVTWPSCDNCTTMHHPSHVVSRPPSQWTWDLRVPTLFLFHLFPSYCMLILLCLLCSGCVHTSSHSQLRGQSYAPWCLAHIPVPFTLTAAIVTNTLQPLFQ